MIVRPFSVPAQLGLSDELGIDRTRLAHDRTMLAWVRTATSLITFGFSIHTFSHVKR
jgi:putative membrane protein